MMKRIVLLVLLFTLAVVGLYYANAYTGAIVENPVSLNIANPHGMLSLVPVKNLEIEQGSSKKALTLTNNMGVYINYKLECSHEGISLGEDAVDVLLAPGDSDDIWLEVSGDCTPGPISLELILSARFDGGRAEIKKTLPLTVLEVPRLEQATLEAGGEGEAVEQNGEPGEEDGGGNGPPADPVENPPAGGTENLTDHKESEENNPPQGSDGKGDRHSVDQQGS